MFFSTLLCAAAALSGMVNAQGYSANDITIVPSSVDPATRQDWCTTQQQNCPLLCPDEQAFPNTCDAGTLLYQCVCTNGGTPNISDYSGTIPSYICIQWQKNCIQANLQDAAAQARCLSVKCGSKAVVAAVVTSSSSTVAPTSSSTMRTSSTTGTPSRTSGAAVQSSTGAASTIDVAQQYGTGILVTALLALFGFAL